MDQEYSIRTLLLYAHDIDVNVYIYIWITPPSDVISACVVCVDTFVVKDTKKRLLLSEQLAYVLALIYFNGKSKKKKKYSCFLYSLEHLLFEPSKKKNHTKYALYIYTYTRIDFVV